MARFSTLATAALVLLAVLILFAAPGEAWADPQAFDVYLKDTLNVAIENKNLRIRFHVNGNWGQWFEMVNDPG
ncbi:MAG: hypothetical protein FJY67_09985 [Calditrichaeota bacterium]|nr:hypothetical protein [Calditrichota bacterium]